MKARQLALRCFLLVIACVLFPDLARAQLNVSTINTGAPPPWVVWHEAENAASSRDFQGSDGQALTLLDTQMRVASAQTFFHLAKEIVTETGVQSGANLSFSWDPSFQNIVIHKIDIQRGGKSVNRLDRSKFKIIQQESDLNRQIYNGALTAVVFLEDVRVGDRIEYAFTVAGNNPSMKGLYMNRLALGWGVPVAEARIRLLWPDDRDIHIRTQGKIPKPRVETYPGVREYVWEARDVASVVPEDRIPSWHSFQPFIQLSEFADWAAVAAWAEKLYVKTNLDAPELQQEIAKLRRPGADAAEVVRSALDFVQNDIRYLGIEFGPNSYHPTHPLLVLQRRFGDCKDKAFLLCTLLNGLGYEADPVLVATDHRHTLPGLLPSPNDFDHVIVRVTAEGKTHWVDPTRSYQRGAISERYLPDYGYGLAVRKGETGLTRIPPSRGNPESKTLERFRIGGQNETTRLNVTTTYRGFDAEWMRSLLTTRGSDAVEASVLNDYAHRYPGVMKFSPMAIQDSTNSDELVTSQIYAITNFWTLTENSQVYVCQFYPTAIHSWITKPGTALRTMPMEVAFPRSCSVETVLELPREFKVTDTTNTISGPGAELRARNSHRGKMVRLEYDYRSLTNVIPASLTGRHLNSLDEMERALGYQLTIKNPGSVVKQAANGSTGTDSSLSQFNWTVFLLALVYSIALASGAVFFSVHQSRKMSLAAASLPPPWDTQYQGLGGWLIVVGFGLCLSPIRLLFHLYKSTGGYSLLTWQALTVPGGPLYEPLYAPVTLLELLSQITLFVFVLIALALFFQKRLLFPRFYTGILIFNTVYVCIDTLGAFSLRHTLPEVSSMALKSLIQACIASAIWIPYLRQSRRVRATFVR